MKRPNLKPVSARSLKVSLLATLGVYMALSSSHWASPDAGRMDLLSSRSSEVVGLNEDTLLTNRARAQLAAQTPPANPQAAAAISGVASISDDSVLTARSQLEATARAEAPNEMAGLNEDLALNSAESTTTVSAEVSTPAEEPSESDLIIELCEKKFNATTDGDRYTFTEVMETDCTDCVVTSYTVAVQAESIVRTLEEVAVSTISDQVCEQTQIFQNPDLQASNAEVVETEGDEAPTEVAEEELSAWDQCGEQDDIIALQCYADVLSERRGVSFIEEILAGLGDDPTHMQFLNAVKVRMNDVNRLLEELIQSEDEIAVSQVGETSRAIADSLDAIFRHSKFKRLGRNSSVSTSMANLVNRSAAGLVASYQTWGRKGDFRVRELTVQMQTAELTAQSELLRRQMVGLNPESAQLLRGFMTSYTNTTSNPRYFMDGFYRMQMDQGFQVQLRMLQNLDPSAAALAYQWQTLAQEGITLRAETGSALQQIIQTESNPSSRAAMLSGYNNVLQGIGNSYDLTRNDLYDPYFMSFDLLNLRAGSDLGRTSEPQFYTQPVVAESISSLPGNSQHQGALGDMLNSRAGGSTAAPDTTVRPGVGRVSY